MFSMSHADLMNAYAACKAHFGLKAPQRTLLDASPYYLDVMIAAHSGDWGRANDLLWDAGVLVQPTPKVESRAAFYADDKIWQHENCGTECDGSDHA